MTARRGAEPGGLSLAGIQFTYRPRGRAAVEALAGVDLDAPAGRTTAIIGPNGCGKSTLLRIASGMLEPDSGTVSGEPAALMPQQDLLLPWAGALDNAALALRSSGTARGEAREQAAEWFARLGLEGFEDSLPHELSGGMRRRVAFVRTVLAGQDALALDEPFAALDALSRLEARSWLASALGESGRTALLVTHDVDEALAVASRVVVLTGRPARTLEVHEVDGRKVASPGGPTGSEAGSAQLDPEGSTAANGPSVRSNVEETRSRILESLGVRP